MRSCARIRWGRVLLVGTATTGCTARVLEWDPGAGATATMSDGGSAATSDATPETTGDDTPETTGDEPGLPPDAFPGPPRLVEVRFVDNQTLRLSYSEPMADPGPVTRLWAIQRSP